MWGGNPVMNDHEQMTRTRVSLRRCKARRGGTHGRKEAQELTEGQSWKPTVLTRKTLFYLRISREVRNIVKGKVKILFSSLLRVLIFKGARLCPG